MVFIWLTNGLFRYYFAIQTNPGEQFFLFTSLAAWLVRKIGCLLEQPQEYDDPNSTIAGMLDATRDLVSDSTWNCNIIVSLNNYCSTEIFNKCVLLEGQGPRLKTYATSTKTPHSDEFCCNYFSPTKILLLIKCQFFRLK